MNSIAGYRGERIHIPIMSLSFSFKLDLKLEGTLRQFGYERKEREIERTNQIMKEHAFII